MGLEKMFEHDYQAYPELTNGQLSDFGLSSPHPQLVDDFRALVVKVHDGDTVTLRIGSRNFDFPLRLLGINAPELSEGGVEAREWLKSRLLLKDVDVLIDSSNRVGKYGRLLGRILSDGLIVGDELLWRGLALPFERRDEGKIPVLDKVFSRREAFT